MRRQFCFGLVVLCFAALLAPFAARAQASADQTSYTFVSEWGVPCDKWADYTASGEKLNPVLDKLMADGTLIAWGRFTVVVHEDAGDTHGLWWTAKTLGNLLRAQDAIAQNPASANPILAGFKHHDHIMRSLAAGGKPGASGSGYLWVSIDPMKTGQLENFAGIFKKDLQPVFDQLVAGGTLFNYSFSTEVVHTGNENTVFITYLLNGPDALDTFRAAIFAAEARMPTFGPAVDSLVQVEGHRDAFLHVTSFTSK